MVGASRRSAKTGSRGRIRIRTDPGRLAPYFKRGNGPKRAGLYPPPASEGSQEHMRERLAHVTFRGTIRERSVDPYLRLLRGLRERRRVKGVLLDISSGGGEAIASLDFYLALKRLDAVKPVVASIGSLGASGAYMAALGARRIFAYPESAVGSIGVIFPHLAVRDLLRRLGISVELLHVGVHKDAYQGYRPLTEEERAKLQAVAQESYDGFVGLVARERKRPLEEIRALATGEFWSGTRSLQLGLVDALGDHESALEELSRIDRGLGRKDGPRRPAPCLLRTVDVRRRERGRGRRLFPGPGLGRGRPLRLAAVSGCCGRAPPAPTRGYIPVPPSHRTPMPDSKRSGFSSAAGLIQYYDMEETRSLKINPYIVLGIGIVAAVFVEILNWRLI